ncbi:MAG: recombinase family protein [Defluviitaleaceae bacterium]|nr:recombinase family protein [Defluviitaleaceae bacterium]
MKRKSGAFVGAFAVYGYMKDSSNHNMLVVDKFAADVVNDIFNWKMDGLSSLGIAERLNERGILSPMEYKRYSGLSYNTPFKKKTTAKWQAKAVSRILANEIYVGILEQGKRITPNYKVRKRVNVPREQWARVENTHEPIIERELFYTVQELLKQDTRAASKNSEVRPLSGIIFCADCKAAMVHKTTTKNGKRRGYYVCSAHRANKEICSTHVIRSDDCETAVIEALKNYISSIIEIDEVLACVGNFAYSQGIPRKLTARLEAKKEELRRNNEYRLSLHESYADGIIRREDFINFKSKYDIKIQEAEAAIISIKEEIAAAAGGLQNHAWANNFKSYKNFDSLARKMVVKLLKKVMVHENGRITVYFHYSAELEHMLPACSAESELYATR